MCGDGVEACRRRIAQCSATRRRAAGRCSWSLAGWAGQPDRTQSLAHRSGPGLTALPPLPGTPRIHRRSARSPLRGGRPTAGRVTAVRKGARSWPRT